MHLQLLVVHTFTIIAVLRSTMSTTRCEFVNDSGIVAFNGIDRKPFLLPTLTAGGKTYLRFDFTNRDVALFFTSKNVSSRPFKSCSIKKVLADAVRAAFDDFVRLQTTEANGDAMLMEEECGAEQDPYDSEYSRMKAYRHWKRFEGRLCEVDVPKSPKSADCRRMWVHQSKQSIEVHATVENITWLQRYVRSELGLLDKPARK